MLSPTRRAAIIRPYVKPGRDVPRWIAADWARSIGLAERWAEAESTIPLPGYAQRQRYGVYAYAQRYIGHESVQAYAERLGVELRHPFHDLRLTRFVMGLPGNALRRGNVRKYLLREAMRGTLPEAVRTRGDKAVFQRAIRDAVATHFARHPPETMQLARLGWIDAGTVRAAVDRLASAPADGPRADLPVPVGRLWFLVAIEIWLAEAAGFS